MTAPIANIEFYNSEMSKSLIDKIYFLDKVDADVFIDFGCADGTMLKFIANIFPNLKLLGYDNDPAMIAKAIEDNNSGNIQFTCVWDEVRSFVSNKADIGLKSCLILSSVIHEVHSYLSSSELVALWEQIWGVKAISFDYIAIRDMMVSRTTSRPSDPLQVARIRQLFDHEKLDDWESHWGSIDENWSLVHFLLTYRYTNSWKREVAENYLPINIETFLSSIPRSFYPIFKEHFTLPFLRRRIRDDFGIELADRTHIKLILEKT